MGMRDTLDVDLARFRQILSAAGAARDRGDIPAEADHLARALGLLIGRPQSSHFDEAAEQLRRGLAQSTARLADEILFIAGELGIVLIGVDITLAYGWVNLVEEALGMPGTDEDERMIRLRTNMRAAQSQIRHHMGEEGIVGHAAILANSGVERGASSVAALAATLDAARERRRLDGPAAVLAAIAEKLDMLDPAATHADAIAYHARLMMREVGAATPADARRAVHDQINMLPQREHRACAVQLVIAAGYARDAGRRDHMLRDGAGALEAAAATDSCDLQWSILGALAEFELSFGRRSSAILLMKLALDAYCRLRGRMANFDPDLDSLDAMAEPLLGSLTGRLADAGRLAEAEHVAGMAWARSMAAVPTPPLTECEADVADEIMGRLSTRSMGALRYTLDSLEQRSRNIGPSTFSSPPSAYSDAAEGRSASLSFVTQADRLACIVRSPGGEKLIDLDLTSQNANRLVFAIRNAIAILDGSQVELLERAHRLLLKTVLGAIPPDVTDLSIGASGSLHALPWAALHDGQRHLVERFSLRRTTIAPIACRARPGQPRLAGFGVTSGHAGLSALGQDVRDEIERVAALIARSDVRIDDRFTKAALENAAADASVLHVASHFVAHPGDPRQSRLSLGGGQSMTLPELLSLDLSGIDLLILSACSTAFASGGRDDRSLDIALAVGGAGAVIGTLWNVDSHAMALLVPDMMKGLSCGLSKPQALACTQRRLIDGTLGDGRYRLPYYFAAPVMSGDPRPWDGGGWLNPQAEHSNDP